MILNVIELEDKKREIDLQRVQDKITKSLMVEDNSFYIGERDFICIDIDEIASILREKGYTVENYVKSTAGADLTGYKYKISW